MQEHILKKSHEELERTHRLVNSYKDVSIMEKLQWIFWKSFKNILIKYAEKKEEILLNYSNLYSDIWKDIIDTKAKAIDWENIRQCIDYITESIKDCWDILETLISHNTKQDDIIEHEKVFFVDLLSSFHTDIKKWIGAHEKEIFWEVTELESKWNNSPLIEGKALLELQKKRLESHMQNINNS